MCRPVAAYELRLLLCFGVASVCVATVSPASALPLFRREEKTKPDAMNRTAEMATMADGAVAALANIDARRPAGIAPLAAMDAKPLPGGIHGASSRISSREHRVVDAINRTAEMATMADGAVAALAAPAEPTVGVEP